MNRLLQNLNEAQLQAVSTTEGPLLVIAGAGSGKTRVLTRRVAYVLTERLGEPYQVLAVTFTNKAAGEMKDRIEHLLGTEVRDLSVSTFHSFCARLLRTEADALGYDSDYIIYDSADSETLMKNCLKEMGMSKDQFPPKAQLRKISNAKNQFIGPAEFARTATGHWEEGAANLYRLYQKRLRECNAMDFDDLLFNTVSVLKKNTDIGIKYRSRFRYLMVDEYQDTNHVQYLLLKELLGTHNNICVVGDEDQSIYGWRGADIRNILDFENDFPGAQVIKLEENYRSTDVILRAASKVISCNQARKAKTLRSRRPGGDRLTLMLVDTADDEAHHVIARIRQEQANFSLKDMVILYRTNAQSRAFEEHLRRQALPYQIVGGISFYERKEIKDLMAYLKLIVNRRDDVSFQRIINYPKRGIGEKSVADLAVVARGENCSLYDVALKIGTYDDIPARPARLIKPFVELMEKYREKQETVPVDILVNDLIKELNLVEEFRSENEIIGQTRVENIQAFVEGVAQYALHYPHATLADYLSEITLYTDIDTYDEAEEKLTLMTLHAAKGLEFDYVFLVGLEDGLFPLARTINQPMELEEERRLFYVGATRAKRRLCLSAAGTRHRFGAVQSKPSRFIQEIPLDLIDTVDVRTYTSETPPTRIERQRSFLGSTARARVTAPVDEGVHYEYEGHESLRSGRVVHHPTFGRGTIHKVEGYGESLVLEIMFAGVGPKRIMAKYAKLRVIG